ncbi:MAG: Flp pilus assembly protein CpaB, partial [Devosia sp.]|nr:Flp pilus assembly protein CpaB [Devosia sp.]
MRASRIILLLVALLAGGLAAYFFVATTNTPPQQVMVEGPTQVIQERKARILVARTQIGVGQRLSEATIEWQDWPELAVRPEYITDAALPDALTQMDGAVARFEFFPGEPIMQVKLVHSDQGYLSAVLPKGMRAIPVQVSAASASGGYILPNDRVDVVLSSAGASGSISRTILENVKVLAIGTRLGEAGTTGAQADPEDP